MNYAATLDYLYTQLPMFTRIGGAAYKADLHNTIALCNALGNPQNNFKSIHIAGTNGKGSTSHMLAAILQTAGYKTGLYTSPHLYDFRERIKINGAMCTEAFVVSFTQKIKPLIEELQPSFFEITVAMAFSYFAEQQVDIAIIEVGMGGRLDSTNIIHPLLSIITNIGYDHMQFLGNTLPEIAGEKAGIIKKAVPVIIGEPTEIIKPVFDEKAKKVNAPLLIANEHYTVLNHSTNEHLVIEVKNHLSKTIEQYLLDLTGIYQTKNLPAVLTATDVLNQLGIHIKKEHIHTALSNVTSLTGLQGRWEKLAEKPTIIADVGHNEDGIKQIVKQIAFGQYAQVHIVLGMVKDKDVEKVLALMPKDAFYYFTQAQIPRALPTEVLKNLAMQYHLSGDHYPTVNEAILAAKIVADNNKDIIIVCGSFFIIAEIDRKIIGKS